MTFDLQKIRAETPGINNRIHFNNAGASLMASPIHHAVLKHLDLEMQIGGYEAQDTVFSALEHTYDAIAALINCSRDEVALMENASAAWSSAFHGMALQKGDRILTAEAEYASNVISYLQMAEKKGVKIDVIPSDTMGQTDVAALENMIDGKVKLISISHIPTNGGLINPAREIGAIARKHKIPYLLDACQSVGQIPLDVEKIGCDMLSATGRKYLRAPRGTGFLYVRKNFMEQLSPPFLDLHSADWTSKTTYKIRSDARRFENWERNIAAVIGLGVAVDYFMNIGVETASKRLCALAAEARTGLSNIRGFTVHDVGPRKGGIVTFTHDRVAPAEIKNILHNHDINITTTPITATRYDMEKRSLNILARASFHYYNNEEELAKFLNVLQDLQK
ncbi:MAG: aminotransferase class V-fold PLP-dependent enzyme [Sneathiella sp.]|nr:aminotransferase class V-fold PLP-dependent enzyme [Sneathiella sp.]